MKLFLATVLTGLLIMGCGSNKAASDLPTAQYAGTYQSGNNIENGPVGSVIIHPQADGQVLFYLSLNRGTPSYNSGALYGQLRIENDEAVFFKESPYATTNCKWHILFKENGLIIETVDGQNTCGFGYGVVADGTYLKTSDQIPAYFKNGEGRKIFFDEITPEKYYSNGAL